MAKHDIIAIGASIGGVEVLTKLARGLPADLPAALFVVLHIPPTRPSMLPRILDAAGPLPAMSALDEQPILPGRIYVAPPDRHLILEPGMVRVVQGPKENGHRPAVDPLFRSAARSYRSRVVGVVMTGGLDCGTAGLLAIKRLGGVTVVQDPSDAYCGDMPRSALNHVQIDHCVSGDDMAALLSRLANEEAKPEAPAVSSPLDKESMMAATDPEVEAEIPPGTASAFGCPDCGGVLYEVRDGEFLHFRCRVGHAFGIEGFQAQQQNALEGALCAALRALEEQGALFRRLAQRARDLNQTLSAASFAERGRAAEHQARLVRQAIQHGMMDHPATQSGSSSNAVAAESLPNLAK